MERQLLQVSTPVGHLTAIVGHDATFPSIDLQWNDKTVAVLEFDPVFDPPSVRLHVWKDNAEEPNLSYVIEPREE